MKPFFFFFFLLLFLRFPLPDGNVPRLSNYWYLNPCSGSDPVRTQDMMILFFFFFSGHFVKVYSWLPWGKFQESGNINSSITHCWEKDISTSSNHGGLTVFFLSFFSSPEHSGNTCIFVLSVSIYSKYLIISCWVIELAFLYNIIYPSKGRP